MSAPYFFYLARCKDGSLYAGITGDIAKREARHNRGTGARYTGRRRPIVIVHSERFISKSDAAKREREVKRWNRRKKIRLILASPMAQSITAFAEELKPRRGNEAKHRGRFPKKSLTQTQKRRIIEA